MRTARVVIPLLVALATLLIVGTASASFNQTSLATHSYGGDTFKTRQSQTYFDHNTTDIEFGHAYHYAKAVDGCILSRSGYIYYDNSLRFPAELNTFNLLDVNGDPDPLCDPDENTVTWHNWGHGQTWIHGAQEYVMVETYFHTGDLGSGLSFGWHVYFTNVPDIEEYCVVC